MRLVKCYYCSKRWLLMRPSSIRNYVRLFTHVRLNHWDAYLERRQSIHDELNGLID